MKPLYQMVAQYRELATLDPEEIDEQVLAEILENLGGEITEKATNVAAHCRNLEVFADSIEEAARAMQTRAVTVRKKSERIRAYLLNCMRGAGVTKIQSPQFTVSIRKNPVAVQIAPDAKIPDEFMVTPEPPPPRVDKKALAEALKAGTVVDGCWLEQGERLDIR